MPRHVPEMNGNRPTPAGDLANGPTDEFVARLRSAAMLGLPGPSAQRRFEPPWGFGRHYGPPPSDVVPAAVIALLYPSYNRITVVLTLRHTGLTAHAGQISLPGGRIEIGESDWNAAVRELHEELGVPAASVAPLAPLSPLFIFATNYYVRPWLAWCDQRPTFIANPNEVAGIIEVPIEQLRDPQNWGKRRMTIRGVSQDVPYMTDGDSCIWGATAMVLSEIAALFDEVSPLKRFEA